MPIMKKAMLIQIDYHENCPPDFWKGFFITVTKVKTAFSTDFSTDNFKKYLLIITNVYQPCNIANPVISTLSHKQRY